MIQLNAFRSLLCFKYAPYWTNDATCSTGDKNVEIPPLSVNMVALLM